MALEMQALETLRVKWADEGLSPPLHVRMGLATGYATVGNLDLTAACTTAIGNAVNSAARIQALAPATASDRRRYPGSRSGQPVMPARRHGHPARTQAHPVQLEVTAGQSARANDFVVGSGDGFRLFLDSAVLSDKQKALSLLREAVRQIEEQDDPPA